MESYSVLISVYEKEKAAFFREAVDSMLRQTVKPDEIVIVCDGALTPPLERSIADYQKRDPALFHVVRMPEHRGLGLALQEGLRLCRNELVARMDTDDIALPDRMEKQLQYMKAHPQICAVGGQIAEFRDHPGCIVDFRIVPTEPEMIRKMACRRNPMNHMTVLLRKSSVLSAGNYRHLPGYEDYDLWARMLADGQLLGNIADVCCLVRVDARLYASRGGLTYFRHALTLEEHLLSCGMITGNQFCQNVALRFAGAVMVPAKVRQVLMKNLMRECGPHRSHRLGAMQWIPEY